MVRPPSVKNSSRFAGSMTGGGASRAARILLGAGGLFLLLGNATYVPAGDAQDVVDNQTQWVLSRLFLALAAAGLGSAGLLLAAAAAPALGTTGRIGGTLLAVGSLPLLAGELILAVAATRLAADGDAAFSAALAMGGALQEAITLVYAAAAVIATSFALHGLTRRRRIGHGAMPTCLGCWGLHL